MTPWARYWHRRSAFALAFVFAGMMSVAVAQTVPAADEPLIQRGDAVVTGFSGVVALKPKPNAKLEDYLIIDTQAPALQFFDLSQMFGGDNARLVDAPRLHAVPAGQIGQVFGVTLDDGRPADGVDDGRDPVPNIYATATSAYGLQLVETKQVGKGKVRERAKIGSPDVSWMDGQFGVGGGPGSIWRIDGRTGEASLFADVTFDGVANSAPALGAITFDPTSRRLYVSDLQTGMIHAFDLTGAEVDRYDHGVQGRPAEGLTEVAFDPASRVEITSPAFNAEDLKTWGFAPRERKVWGLAVHGRRLFYSVDDGPTIWSIGLRPNGEFAKDARAEIDVRTKSGNAISALAFSRGGTIYLSQRGATVPTYDYQVMATPQTAQTLRYKRETLPNGDIVWRVLAEEYAIGQSGEHRSSNGGVALGYGYDANGFIRHDVCEGTVWTTGEILRQTAKPDPLLTAGGETVVQGLQGTPTGAVMPNNAPPLQSFYIDYDRQFLDPGFRGHMGQVAIWGCDGGPRVSAAPRPHGPHIKIAKKCSSAGFGNRMHCRVTLFNAGDEAPVWPVGFSDEADIRHGPANASRIRIVSATPSHPGWKCSAVPTSEFGCKIDGELLRPGRRRYVDVVMDVSGIASTPGFRVRNCAFLGDESDFACTSGGEDLVVQKTGDQLCEAGQLCTFDLSVTNVGRRTFDGRLFLADNISLPGVPALDVAFISPPIPGCDPATLPFQCNAPMTLGPGRSRTFVVTVEIPRNAVRPGRTVQGRNCFFASDPGLIPDGGRRRVSFLKATLKTLNPNGPSAGPGFACFKFTVQAPGIATIPPRCDVPVARLRVTPTPASFNAANQKIKVELAFTNTGNNKFEAIEDWKVAAPQLKNLTCASQRRGLDPRTFALCKGEYTTKATDFGKPIELTATAIGDSACGKIAAVKASGTVAFTGAPVLVLAATPSPATYKAANEKISYTYIVKNTGSFPIPLFSLNGGKATDVKCAAGGPVLSFSACASSNSTCAKLAAGASLTCTGSYTTKASDVGKDIVTIARAEGGTTIGAIGQLNPKPDLVAAPVKLLVKYAGPPVAPPLGILGNPAMTLAVTPSPATFSKSNQKITYNYTLKNTGTVPFTFYGFKDTVATDVKCSGPAVQAKLCAQIVAGSGFCGSLAVGASTTCTGSYTTKPGDIGKDLASKVSFTGKIDADPNSVDFSGETDAVVKFTASPSAQPKLEITKYTPKSATFAAANEKIAYHYIISNIGDAALISFTLTDNRVTSLKCQPKSAGPQGGPMAPGQALSCSGTYTTTAADVGKDIASTANVTATVDTSVLQSIQNIFVSPASPGAGSVTATANAVVKFKTNPGATAANSTLGIAATVSPSSYLGSNEKLTYSFKVTNNGSVPLTSFTLVATKATGIKCSPSNGPKGGPLAPGAIATCTGSYKTQPVDVGAKAVAAKVSVTATSAAGAVPPSRTATIEAAFKGSMGFTLAVIPVPATFSAAGQKITYSYTLKNTGNVPVTGLSLSESKPAAFDCPGPRGANGKGQSPDIAVGATLVCKRVYTTVAADLGKDIASTMTATGAFDIGNGTWRSGEQKKASAVVKFAAPVARPVATKPPELKVLHFAGALDATGKKQITFAGAKQRIDVLIQVFNHGGPATNLTVTGSKITDIKCTKPDAGAPFIGPTVGPVAAGAVTSCLAHYTTTAADVGKDFDLEAQVVATTPSGPVTGTPKKITVKFAGKPELKLSVRAEPDDYRAAKTAITYTYTLDNIGPVPATSFAITDNKVTGIKCAPANTGAKGGPLAPGASVTCIGTYTTKPGDIPNSIINVASVTGATAAGKMPPQKPANAQVTFSGKPRLVVHTYQAKPRIFSAANQKITYTYFVFNYGQLPVASFTIADSKVKDIKCAPANSGASGGPIGITNGMVECVGTYTTTAADVGKPIVSHMTVTGTSALGPIPATSEHEKENTVAYKAPAVPPRLKIFQYVTDVQGFAGANQRIQYQYGIRNMGTVPLKSYVVTDSKASLTCGPAKTSGGGGPLAVKADVYCRGVYMTTAADVGKDIVSEATVVGKTAAGTVSPAVSAKRTVAFTAPPAPVAQNFEMMQVKAVPSTFSAAGEKIDYVMIVKGNGVVPATATFMVTGKKISDIKCAPAYTGPVGRGPFTVVSDCKGSYTTTAADVGKDIESRAEVTSITAAGMSPPKAAAAKTAVVKFAGKAAFDLHHECFPKVYASPGQVIGCEFVIRNTGTVPIQSCRITGSRLNAVCPTGMIPPGGSVLVKGSYTSTLADVGKNIVIDYKIEGLQQ